MTESEQILWQAARGRRKATSERQRWRFAPVGRDHQRSEASSAQRAGGGDAAAAAAKTMRVAGGHHKESPQRSNDRRDTDHEGRTADLQGAGREMEAEAVAGEKKSGGGFEGDGWGLGFEVGVCSRCMKYVRGL
ncbi:hypothetical protein Scep_019608 [Stephania cephalantha]|uniref:Uncharacterized protein n=1 Tax=Stephania cephalantha TaxID=152367 RepID=A0AAP0NN34_9MAGN